MDDAYESTLGLSVHSLITIIWKEKKNTEHIPKMKNELHSE